ncbi:hypothetical protein Esti_005292 [Eimeria stiedai]
MRAKSERCLALERRPEEELHRSHKAPFLWFKKFGALKWLKRIRASAVWPEFAIISLTLLALVVLRSLSVHVTSKQKKSLGLVEWRLAAGGDVGEGRDTPSRVQRRSQPPLLPTLSALLSSTPSSAAATPQEEVPCTSSASVGMGPGPIAEGPHDPFYSVTLRDPAVQLPPLDYNAPDTWVGTRGHDAYSLSTRKGGNGTSTGIPVFAAGRRVGEASFSRLRNGVHGEETLEVLKAKGFIVSTFSEQEALLDQWQNCWAVISDFSRVL